jgi:hypothetical protein
VQPSALRKRSVLVGLAALVVSMAASPGARAQAPLPSGPHPRLFINSTNLPKLMANAAATGTVAARIVKRCQNTIDKPQDFTTRGGADGDNWPGAAVACAFAYVTTQNATFLTQAIKYWRASLNDDQNIGDNLGCVQGVNTDWQSNTSSTAPPIIATVTHDTGYPG